MYGHLYEFCTKRSVGDIRWECGLEAHIGYIRESNSSYWRSSCEVWVMMSIFKIIFGGYVPCSDPVTSSN